jgi:hypothetical protein
LPSLAPFLLLTHLIRLNLFNKSLLYFCYLSNAWKYETSRSFKNNLMGVFFSGKAIWTGKDFGQFGDPLVLV